MSTHTYKKFEDLDSGALPDKMTVYQECLQAFNASPVQAKRCRLLLSRLLRLLYCGESFPTAESTTLFFSISKLFQHNDYSLRQLVYVAIKELSAVSDDVLMVTSSIMKDIQNGEIIYKPNAIRALARVLDGTTIHAAERIMKNSIVDKNQSVSSAALVSSYHLLPVAKDVVRRWTNETQESISDSKSFPSQQFLTHEYYGANKLPLSTYTYQYHALGLLYHLRNHDKMALMKMIQQLSTNSPLKNSLAIVQLIRYIGRIIEEDSGLTQTLFPLLASWLRHKSDMVELEAAKTILSLPGLTGEQHLQAINTLQVLLSVPRTVTRFAAVRILNRTAMKNPEKIVVCNVELESLINDSNRSISTYAITTLLKTGNSDNVDRLIKTISGFMDDISDEFKIIVIEAVRTLSLKFPEKHQSMLSFLNDVLRDEGGFSFKNAIIEAIFDIIKFVPESRESALETLCEFIEDCEFTELAVRVLHLLGTEGPKTPNPTLYIRHIYNRVVLENSIVRSSAVIALSKFALLGDESISKSIKILLTRCLSDVDDEVRDRAALSLKLLSSKDIEEAKVYLAPSVKYSLPILEQKLALYVSGDKDTFSTPFDISSIPTITEEEAKAYEYKEKTAADTEEIASPGKEDKEDDSQNEVFKQNLLHQQYSQELASIPEIAAYGTLLHSSAVVDLTEKETEFVVTAVKHIFEDHLVIQYNVNNTLTDIQLDDVTIVSQPDAEDVFVEEFIIPIEVLKPQAEAAIYVSFSRAEGIEPGVFVNTLSYTSKDVDPATLEPAEGDVGFPDEYQIEELQVSPGDYITPAFVGNFTHVWDELPNEQSAVYNLKDVTSIEESVSGLIKSLSMMPMESSEIVSSSSHHTLKLYGKSLGGARVATVIRLASTAKGFMMKVQVKSDDEIVSESVANNVV
ncbi:unnamed protein product [Kuraishia capsulata CBS 1993]|uniref:Coatomer subunit gamma n=1 Tax=Kuraishia capsulata CBS 1993 TaxID=1382522 RepID=W6MM74_9ASCO|nr:uncharacterized protein KUCA_T00003276001 [Kuraishia capsulata CBS 1993]CDK27298.1 unnamed protein product [Kuraishia capsulata CBS 1993]